MDPLALLLRMRRLVRHPPSRGRVLLGLAVIALCLALVGIEALGLWPEALTATRARLPRLN